MKVEYSDGKGHAGDFGARLRRHRLQAGLSQEALAERAGISAKAVSDLERHPNRRPRLETARLLAEALGLDGEQRAGLIAAAHPAGSEADVPRSSTPRPLTRFVGRLDDLAALGELVREVRLLTLTGPGGVGKTRLALEAAAAAHSERITFVDLSVVRAPPDVVPVVARQLGVTEHPGIPARDALVAALRGHRSLIILDNMEHLLEVRGDVLDLLSACPQLRLIITSREPLRVRGERVYSVAPLPLPDSSEDAMSSPAVQLFFDRALAAGATIRPDAAGTAGMLCRRLDGLPLAIELAAGWLPFLSLEKLLEGINLSLLRDGPRDLPDRQRTMADAIAWSYALLNPEEQEVFRRLAVFEGGCTLEAAAAVCGVPDILPVVVSLARKSLVRLDDGEKDTRIAMLETIREYGQTQLSDEAEDARARHAEYYNDLAERLVPCLAGPEQMRWERALERDHGNLRAASRWSTASGATPLAASLAANLWPFWRNTGRLSEGRTIISLLLPECAGTEWFHKLLLGGSTLALDAADFVEARELATRLLADGSAVERVRALSILGFAAQAEDRYDDAERGYEDGLLLAQSIQDTEGEALLLRRLSFLADFRGKPEKAHILAGKSLQRYRSLGAPRLLFDALLANAFAASVRQAMDVAEQMGREALTIARAIGDAGRIAEAMFALGTCLLHQRRFVEAVELLQESYGRRLARGDIRYATTAQSVLAIALLSEGRLEEAEAHIHAAERALRATENRLNGAIVLTLRGYLAIARGETASADRHFRDSITVLRTISNPMFVRWNVQGMAIICALEGRWQDAARWIGAGESCPHVFGAGVASVQPALYDRVVLDTLQTLGKEVFEAARIAGGAAMAGDDIFAAIENVQRTSRERPGARSLGGADWF